MDSNGRPVPVIFPGTQQNVAFTTHAESAAFQKNTTYVRLCSTADCWVLARPKGVLTAATAVIGFLLPASAIDAIAVDAEGSISVLQVTAGGTLSITEGL